MAEKDVQALIKKAVTDDVFRNALDNDFATTVETHGIELNRKEVAALRQVNWSASMPGLRANELAGKWVHIYSATEMGRGDIAGPQL